MSVSRIFANRIRHPDRARVRRPAVFGVMVAVLVTGCGTAAIRPSASSSSTSRLSASPIQPSASPTPQTSDLLAGVTVSAADVQASAGAGNALTVDLLQKLASSQPDANFVDSAYSLATALAMLELGAEGDTQSQIGTALHSAGVTPEQQAAAWKQLDASLLATAQTDGISLDVANAIWLQQGLPFNATFLNTLVQNFSAPSSQVDFSGNPQGAANLINQWVSNATDGMIPTVVSAGDVQSLKLVLADAIYFDADWLYQFDPGLTAPGPFHLPDGSVVSAQMMNNSTDNLLSLPTYIGDGVTAVEMPYVGGHFVADVIMPTSQSIGDFVASMSPATLTGIEQNLVSTPYVLLTLPKFDISSQESLIPILQALGMTDAFDSAANFSGIDGGRDLQVGLLKQRAVMHVDEVGTTAAAATVVGGLGGGGPLPPITNIVINHPFLFVIRDTTTGAIVFTAQVVDPTAS
jgi:serpin B